MIEKKGLRIYVAKHFDMPTLSQFMVPLIGPTGVFHPLDPDLVTRTRKIEQPVRIARLDLEKDQLIELLFFLIDEVSVFLLFMQ